MRPSPMVTTMRAIVQNHYGEDPRQVLRHEEIDRPEVGHDDVLVRVHAASVHIGDWHVMTGLPYLLRVVGFGFRAPNVRVRGMDVSGTVEAVGANVTRFRTGDQVFGTCNGSFAEYAATPQDTLALKPEQPDLRAGRDRTHVRHRRTAGASRSRRYPTRPRGPDHRSLGRGGHVRGADRQVVRYPGDWSLQHSESGPGPVAWSGSRHRLRGGKTSLQSDQRYDLILDMGGNRSLSQLRTALRPGGTLVSVGSEQGNRWVGGRGWIQAMLLSRFDRRLRPLASEPNPADLQVLTELIETDKVMPVIDKTYPLSEVPEAILRLKAGDSRGKIVIAV